MRLIERRNQNFHILDLYDRITIKDDLEQLEHALKELLDRGERNIAIGLKHITYLDSTGSAMLIVCYNSARRAGINLRFLDPSSHVAKIFEITKLDSIFEILKEEDLPGVPTKA